LRAALPVADHAELLSAIVVSIVFIVVDNSSPND
jgi:hypothetical protein